MFSATTTTTTLGFQKVMITNNTVIFDRLDFRCFYKIYWIRFNKMIFKCIIYIS